MPDFDKIHDGPAPYQKPCRQFLDGMPAKVVADSLLRSILSTLRDYGDDSIAALLNVANHLNEVSAGPLFSGTIEWTTQSEVIDRVLRQSRGGNKRGLNTVARAAKRLLLELQSGVYMSRDMSRALLSDYITEILKGCFEDPVKRVLHRSGGVYPLEQVETLEQVRLYLLPGIENLVEQILSSGSVVSIRKPPRGRGTHNPTSHLSYAAPANISELPSVYTEDLDAITF